MAMGAKPLRDLVDLVGIEPTTSSMPWKRAPSCATGPRGGMVPFNSHAGHLVSQLNELEQGRFCKRKSQLPKLQKSVC